MNKEKKRNEEIFSILIYFIISITIEYKHCKYLHYVVIIVYFSITLSRYVPITKI